MLFEINFLAIYSFILKDDCGPAITNEYSTIALQDFDAFKDASISCGVASRLLHHSSEYIFLRKLVLFFVDLWIREFSF